MRASRSDRERTVEMLKTAFVRDRLTKDELDALVGQALAARTYADLEAVTAGIPVWSKDAIAIPASFSPHVPRRTEVRRAVRFGAGALGVVIVATGAVAGVAVSPAAGVAVAMFFVILAVITAGFAVLVIRGARALEERFLSGGTETRPW